MDFKQLRNEVQLLRDELAIMKRKYEDIIYNLDTDNFSSRFVKEQGDMRTAIEVNAEGIKTKVSNEELDAYSTKTQTAEAIQNVVSKGAKLDEAISISDISEATDTSKIYVIKETDDNNNVLSETYYYFNDITKSWEILSGDNIYTVFEQTSEGFKLKGNVLIDGGKVAWNENTTPVQTKYSKDAVDWHNEFSADDIYMKMSFDGGKEWTSPMKVVGTDGKDGEDGKNGSSANVTFANVNNALGNLFKSFTGGSVTSMTNAYIYSPQVKGGEFYGCVFYAGEGEGYSQMDDGGFSIYDDYGKAKMGIGYIANGYNYPYMVLGEGTGYSGSNAGLVYKLGEGMWIGDSSVLPYGGDYPGNGTSVNDMSAELPSATGLFIDFSADKIYKYIKGKPTELTDSSGGGSGSSGVAVFG